VRAAEQLPPGVVYAGLSLGVMPAQKLAQTRAGAAGALLISACLPVGEFSATWPHGVAVQVHGMDADPFFAVEGDLDAARPAQWGQAHEPRGEGIAATWPPTARPCCR